MLDHIGTIASIVASIASTYAVFRVRALHVIVNSRLTELLKATGGEQRAIGREEGRQER